MKIVRSIGSVVVGYLIFAFSAFSFFRLTGQLPHQDAPLHLMLGSILVGAIAAVAGGYVAAFFAGYRPFTHGAAVGVLLAVGAVFSLASTLGHGAIWSQLAALILMAPAAVFGGWARARQLART